jgi:hypothetical protein
VISNARKFVIPLLAWLTILLIQSSGAERRVSKPGIEEVQVPWTRGVLLSGDLYHYPEERALNRVPTFDSSQDQTRATRVTMKAFLKKTGAQLWIQHDFVGNARLKKPPAYYE